MTALGQVLGHLGATIAESSRCWPPALCTVLITS